MPRVTTSFLFAALTCAAWAADPEYKLQTEIPIGGEAGWDILTIDAAARRLYLAHATKVVVVDIDSAKPVAEIADTPGVHAFVAIPELQRGFSSNGKENKASVVDLNTRETVAKVDTGESPDDIVYDPTRAEVYVLNHRGNAATVIDAKALKVSATIPLPGSPEFAVFDGSSGRVYCNIEDKSEVAVIDCARHRVMAEWPVSPGQEPTGIALDQTNHHLFSACKKLLVMLDTDSGKVRATVPTGSGADGCAFDQSLDLVLVPCGEGSLTLAKPTDNELKVIQTVTTERGARTIALDPKTHRVFLPTAKFQPPQSAVPSPVRPAIVPNTLKLLVYGPAESQ